MAIIFSAKIPHFIGKKKILWICTTATRTPSLFDIFDRYAMRIVPTCVCICVSTEFVFVNFPFDIQLHCGIVWSVKIQETKTKTRFRRTFVKDQMWLLSAYKVRHGQSASGIFIFGLLLNERDGRRVKHNPTKIVIYSMRNRFIR